MEMEAVLVWLDSVVPTQTGKKLSELERVILKQVWLGTKYVGKEVFKNRRHIRMY